ncbi:hypothetical protein [uncultured Fusobacterium sp.]|uniref:hypothetical protein n=1 Tax=uncultured Fusobacterium sp. TaxID=159267 RepID=UPI00259A6790|nr:hypothetical protein [uncultured Fusobacterium sp.]
MGNFEIIKTGIKDIVIEIADNGISAIDFNNKYLNTVAKHVTIFATFFCIKNAYLGIKERIFIKKFMHFIKELYSYSEEEKDKFLIEILEDNKFEEKLILIIDRIEENEKIKWLSILLRNYINDKITKPQFFRYVNLLLRLSFIDINFLIENTDFKGNSEEIYLLFSQGLLKESGVTYAELAGKETDDILEKKKYQLTPLGKGFSKGLML